jgi:hypothetical protein
LNRAIKKIALCQSCIKYTGWKEITGEKFGDIRYRAKKKGLIFSISPKQIYNLYIRQKKLCALSGVPISFADKTASLDRIDSTKGYTLRNVQWVHRVVNEMKNIRTDEELLDWCQTIVDFHEE